MNRRDFLKGLAVVAAVGAVGNSVAKNNQWEADNAPGKIQKPKEESKEGKNLLLEEMDKKIKKYEQDNKLEIHQEIEKAFQILDKVEHKLNENKEDRNISLVFYDENRQMKTVTFTVFDNNAKVQFINVNGYKVGVIGDKDIGVAQRYKVTINGKSLRVLATKRAPYSNEERKYNDKAINYAPAYNFEDINLNKSIEDYGRKYLGFIINEAIKKIKEIQGNNKYFNKLNEKEGVVVAIVKRLYIIEHIDPLDFYKARGDNKIKDALIKKTLREIGLNRSKSFAYLFNGKGAMGIGQITTPTYYSIDNLINDKKININIPDDISGRKNPIISAIVSLLHCYDGFLVLYNNYKDSLSDKDYEYLTVADYNLGFRGVNRILKDAKIREEKAKSDKSKRDKKNPTKTNKNNVKNEIVKNKSQSNKRFTVKNNIRSILLEEKESSTVWYGGPHQTANYIQKYLFLEKGR